MYVMMEVPKPELIRTLGLRDDVLKVGEEAGADVAYSKVIRPIKEYWFGD